MFCENYDSSLTTQYKYIKHFSIIIIGSSCIPKINIWKVIKTHKTIKTINSVIRKSKIINYSTCWSAVTRYLSQIVGFSSFLSNFFTAYTHTHTRAHTHTHAYIRTHTRTRIYMKNTLAQFFSLPTNRMTKLRKRCVKFEYRKEVIKKIRIAH